MSRVRFKPPWIKGIDSMRAASTGNHRRWGTTNPEKKTLVKYFSLTRAANRDYKIKSTTLSFELFARLVP
jgi:hypothetical protein